MVEEEDIKKILPYIMYETIERAGIGTAKQILLLSTWDIQELTKMRTTDIKLMKSLVADRVSPQCVTCDKLYMQEQQNSRVTTGCNKIDVLLRGGLRRGALAELYGESGSGKTQLALQAAMYNWYEGCVYLCTEDMFPIKRFEQIKEGILDYNPYVDYGKNIFIEYITEASDLLSCIRVRLPKLLAKHHVSLILVDSVAAPFRSEYSNYIQRAELLREMAFSLITLSRRHNLAVLCINQVTAAFNSTDDMLPSLGLAWSNMVSTRLFLKKTSRTACITNQNNEDINKNKVHIREFSITFAPDLPYSKLNLIITGTGIECL